MHEQKKRNCLRSSEGRTRFSLIGVYFPCIIAIVDGGKSFINSIGVIGVSSVVDEEDVEEVADDEEETAGAACAVVGVDCLVDVEVDDVGVVDVSFVVDDDEVDSADVDEVETAAVAFIFVNKSRSSCFSIHADI